MSPSSARRLDEPLRWIAENAGHEGYVVVAEGRASSQGRHRLQRRHRRVRATWSRHGVIDPVKVTRTAVANAASIAGLLLTTETLVVEKPRGAEPAEAAATATATATQHWYRLSSEPHRTRPGLRVRHGRGEFCFLRPE